jgi:hypothetical protein
VIGVAIGCLIVGAGAGSLFCRFFVAGDRVGRLEEEGKGEVKEEGTRGAQEALPQVLEDSQDQDLGNDKADSDSDHDMAPAQPEENLSAGAEKEDSSGLPPAEFEASGQEAPAPEEKGSRRRPRKATRAQPVKEKPVKDEAEAGGIEVIENEEIQITSAVGERSSVTIPLEKQLWARRQIEAHFEPERTELWLSSAKAWVEPGACEFPFKLFFGPTESVSLQTTLIVSFGEFEVHVPIVASTEGGTRRHRRHRSE